MITRRELLALAALAPALARATNEKMRTRPIPRSGEALPVIGLGTWQTFDVRDSTPLGEVLARFFAGGGRLIDSSPMYGRAEAVLGELLAADPHPAFLATKVWTSGRAEGERQMRESLRRLRVARLDLMQVHNLVDWKTQLATMRAWRDAGTFRYLGITQYQLGAFAQMERLIRAEKLDFVQLPYSIGVREAEKRLLPAAADTQTAVIVMRPFEGGSLFSDVGGKPVPPWAAEIDCTSWAQIFLKFIVSHAAVTCAIPATSKVNHLVDNVQAGYGRLPDDALKKRILRELGR